MELRQLRYFACAARELNFTRAARYLRVAQPALSRQIRQLEEELGGALFLRDRRKVALTGKGKAFLAQAEAILSQADLAIAQARAGRGEIVRVGYVWGLFHTTAPTALQRLREAEPELVTHLFDLSASEQSAELRAGNLDFGFIGVSFEAELAALERQAIGRCEFRVVLPAKHPLARRRRIGLGLLQDELFLAISDERFPGVSRLIREACDGAGFQPRVLQMADRGHTLLGLVAAGAGIAILPGTLQALPHPGVVFREPEEPIECDLFLAWRRGLNPGLIESFMASIA